MSILINGMDMPKQGEYQARLVVYKEGLASLSVTAENVTTTYDIVEIPTPHGRLIDADAHIQSLKENQCGERCRKNHDCVNCGIGMYIRIVENEPTIIEAEGKT